MQAVPSLVGTGTAVAAASTGLVFGQLADTTQQDVPSPPNTGKRKAFHQRTLTPTFLQSSSRPSTSRPRTTNCVVGGTPPRDQLSPPPMPSLQLQSAAPVARPRIPRTASHAQLTPPKSAGLRPTTSRQTDLQATAPNAENARDSVSSNGSWVKRRLSVRPLSQHGSQRSSGGPDAQSLFSFGSGAPILGSGSGSGSGANTPPQRAPNKLVKRASAANNHGPNTSAGPSASSGPLKRSGSRTQMTLRRPATSHQRSATLEQLNLESLPPLPMSPAYAPAPENRPRAQTLAAAQQQPQQQPALEVTPEVDETPVWRSFWHARISRVTGRNTHLRLAQDNAMAAATKRIRIEQPQAQQAPYLMSPSSAPNADITDSSFASQDPDQNIVDWDDSPRSNVKSQSASPEPTKSPLASPDFTPSKKPRRSLSTHFHSPSNWITKTGSIRRRKRGETMGDDKRHASAPTSTPAGSRATNQNADVSPGSRAPSRAESDLAAIFQPPSQPRNSSSPLPPLSRLSSFHADSANRSPSSTTPVPHSNGFLNDAAPIMPSQHRVESGASHTRTLERASTVASSEYHRGFTSGEDDDTDTPFDSLRTAASARRRNADSPLESMFDESPPSTAGNGKPKRLSIQEILGPAYEPGNRIMEEDENTTPVRGTFTEARTNLRFTSASNFALGADSRLSFDDEDDMDWTEGDESAFFNNLSPPSSMNSRRGSPSLRMALANISGNTAFDPHHDPVNERPRSNIFDWVEPAYQDKNKNDSDKSTYRPKTVHGKRELDVRGGRSASRKVPTAAHVRSQSVPAVQDPPETTKATPKFGTWGLGTKNVSEDWDDDFEFEEEDEDADLAAPAGKKDDNRFSMLVPASIQATQPTVKAHSGQIRELSLLVNDLKRLCRLGREMDMLSGSSATLWREAEGVIALASPDEDLAEGDDSKPMSDDETEAPTESERFLAQGYDGASLVNSADVAGYASQEVDKQTTSNGDGRFYGRRRSVFAPEDDIFGNWDRDDKENMGASRPLTPVTVNGARPKTNGVARSVMAAVDYRHSRNNLQEEPVPSVGHKLNFDTNSLKELVKQASDLRDSLSDLVRKADCITQSPARTPKRDRVDGSPAFTRVFDDPSISPSRKLPQSRSNTTGAPDSVGTSPSNGLSQRMQLMTVN